MNKARKAAAFRVTGLDARYAIYVDVPRTPDAGTKAGPWIPVLCLDADDRFEDLRKAREAVGKTHVMPPLLLVGVGYGASYGKPGNRRVRDYTPVPVPDAVDGGGADAFLEFLMATVWPEIEQRYPVHGTIRGIAGHSLGGLFALHALFKREPFFNRVLASAPSIWWGDRAVLDAAATAQADGVDVSATLFVGIGLKDGKSMINDVELLEGQLASRPVRGLDVKRERFPGYTHFSAIPISFQAGLAALFGAGAATGAERRSRGAADV